MNKRFFLKAILGMATFFLAVLFFAPALSGQKINGYQEQQFKLGQSYEQAGKYEEAARIFKELYQTNSDNKEIFEAYYRTYDILHKYSEILPDVEAYTSRTPGAESLMKLASLYWKVGKPAKADSSWNIIFEKFGHNPEVFSDVARELIGLRQYEKAISTLLKGRNKFGSPTLFADYLSRYYPLTGDFAAGTDEIIKLALQAGQASLAKGRLYLYTDSPQAKEVVTAKLKEAVKRYPTNYSILDTYAWYAKLIENFDEAFEAYKQIDEMKKSNGSDLYRFANACQRDGQLDIAEKVYSYILKQPDMKNSHPNAVYGLTQTMEEQLADDDSVSREKLEKIIAGYDMTAEKYPSNHRADQARYNAAMIFADHLSETEEATSRLKDLAKTGRSRDVRLKANNALGSIFLKKGEFPTAKQYYQQTVDANRNKDEIRREALYSLALIEYFDGNADSAKTMFDQVAEELEGNPANDAIEKSGIIENYKSQVKAFGHYRSADYERYVGNFDKAAENYIDASEYATDKAFADKALVEAAEVYRKNSQVEKEFAVYKDMVENRLGGIYDDLAIYKLAILLQDRGELEESMSYYKQLLKDYPKSIYVPEARLKARELRDAIRAAKAGAEKT